jgi:hypothetical protein
LAAHDISLPQNHRSCRLCSVAYALTPWLHRNARQREG